MISDLRYAVTFPTNGVSLNGQLSFQPGSTAISGANGVGKSFIAEMIRYGLFGKKALRGPAGDYKTLDMELCFSVAGADYIVTRAKKEVLIDESGEQLAVGADAVNKKIVEILGFDLEVFDVVCAANQKESERLTRLTPARRKELIDDVVGLTAQETVEKACREESRGLAREAEALERTLVAPVAPEKPKGYRPSSEIREELHATRDLIAQRAELQRIIDAVGQEPVAPEKECPNLEEIEAHEQERVRNSAVRAALMRNIASIPEPTHTRQEIKNAQDWLEYDDAVAALGAKPSIDEPTLILKEMLDTWDEIDVLKRVGEVELHCPKCKHSFCPSNELPEEPTFSRASINADIRARERWAQKPVEPKGKRLTRDEITEAQNALLRADEKKLAQEELDRTPELADRSAELAEARELDKAWDRYVHANEQHMACVAAATDAQTELKKLSVPKHSVDELNAAFTEARVYEEQLTNYDIAKTRFEELSEEVAEKQKRADAFMAGAKGLVEARRTLKAFLAPSLSRVASHLIRNMTVNAKRPLTEIVVDEDMNITADGQDVSTFNGAHATMINLALRLALGQVLVARVFPVFIGDEIDSDADADNSQAIADALGSVKEQLKQIVLISHKRLEGVDHEVML